MKVIAIPNNKTVLISYDYNLDDVKVGKYVDVFLKGPKPIIVNGVNYGTYDYIKETLEITNIFKKFVECKKRGAYFNSQMKAILSPLQTISRGSVDLDVDIDKIDETLELNNVDKTIRIGDSARLV